MDLFTKELPPSEIILGEDVIFIFWASTIQFSILSLLAVVIATIF